MLFPCPRCGEVNVTQDWRLCPYCREDLAAEEKARLARIERQCEEHDRIEALHDR